MTALMIMLVFALLSYVLGQHITAKFNSIQKWKTTKKKRLALAWAVLFGCLILCIKRCQYQAIPIDPQSTYVTLSMLETVWLKKSLNGCLMLSVMMGILFYLGMQSYIQLCIQQQRLARKLRQGLISSL